MNIAFLSEMGFSGKVSKNHPNMRTEFAWMHALDADHIPLIDFNKVKEYDHIFLILPKGKLNLSAEGTKIGNVQNPYSQFYSSNFIDI